MQTNSKMGTTDLTSLSLAFAEASYMRFRVLIADENIETRAAICELLRSNPQFEIVAQAGSGPEALRHALTLAPDLLLLSADLPLFNGFSVVERLNGNARGLAIFLSRDETVANRAFELGALDFLLKPLAPARFEAALARAAQQLRVLETARIGGRLMTALHQGGTAAGERSAPGRIVVRSGGRMLLIKADEIDWIQSEGNYVRLHIGTVSYLHRETMQSIQSRLDGQNFLRIHRTAMVNVERVRALRPHNSGDYVVVLRDGRELPVSRGYRDSIRRLLAS